MKSIIYIFTCSIILLLGCQPSPSIGDQELTILHEKLDEYFTALNQLGKFNGVLLVSKQEKEVIHRAYNLNTDASSSLNVKKSSQFDIHSISKKMAQYLILQLEQEDKINRQDKLSQYIADFPKGDKITIEMLLQHQSGLPRELSAFEGKTIELDKEEMIEYIKQEALIFEPGTSAQYSNLGYLLIYYIIGKQTNSTFEQYLVDNMFRPLGMKNSGTHFYSNTKNVQNLVANHELDEDTIIQVPNILDDEARTGRVYSTAFDLMLMLENMQKNPLAVQISKDSIIQHSGGSDGIRTHIYADLNTNTNFVLLTNFDAIPFQQTLKDITSILNNEPYEVPKKLNRKSVTITKDILKAYEGTYAFADMNIELIFKAEENGLAIFQDGENIGALLAENDTTFFEDPNEPESFEFIPNDKGSYDVWMGWKGVKLKGVKK